jgi:hypothetical protein
VVRRALWRLRSRLVILAIASAASLSRRLILARKDRRECSFGVSTNITS